MTDKELAVRIGKGLRELRGIRTQVGVAKEIGIHQNSLANYENGKRIPNDQIKKKFCEYYNIPISFFYPE